MIKDRVVIFGGAGFIGSQLANSLVKSDYDVTVVDGLLPGTGGNRKNVISFIERINFIEKEIAELSDLDNLVSSNEIIIDAMGWTSHIEGLKRPFDDFQMNQLNHLILFQSLMKFEPRKVVYLGTRSQYGKSSTKRVIETSTMNPSDIQGIHKLAAENYFRIFAENKKSKVLSLRLPNVFGECQKTNGNDIGLIGEIIRTALDNKTIEVFTGPRCRNILYVQDLSEIIEKLMRINWTSFFFPLNIPGIDIEIVELANKIISLAGSGNLKAKNLPPDIAAIDFNASFSSEHLHGLLNYKLTDLDVSLHNTINYFKGNL